VSDIRAAELAESRPELAAAGRADFRHGIGAHGIGQHRHDRSLGRDFAQLTAIIRPNFLAPRARLAGA
jgi:hypothetical protein